MDSRTWAQRQKQRQIVQASQASKVAAWPSQTLFWGSPQTLNTSQQYSASNTRVLPQQSSQGWSNRQNTGVPSQQSSQGWSNRQNTGVPSQQSSQGWSNRQNTGVPSQQSTQGWSPNLNTRVSPQQSCQMLSAMLSTNANTGVFPPQHSQRLRTNVNTRVSPQQSCQTLSAMLSTNVEAGASSHQTSQRLGTNVNTRVSPHQNSQTLTTNVDTGVLSHQQIQIWNKNWQAVSSQQTARGTADQCFNSQSQGGNVKWMVSGGSQVSIQQVIPQISTQTSQTQVNMMTAPVGLSNASQKGFYQILNGGSANTSTVTSFPSQQVASLNISLTTAAHKPNHRQNSVHNGFPSPCAPPSYHTAISKLSQNRIASAQSSVQQVVGDLNNKQQIQQIQIQLNNRRQIDRTNDHHLNSSESMAIARIEEELRNSVPVNLSNRLSIKPNHNVQHTQSNTSLLQPVVFSSKEMPHASMSREQPSIEALPHGSSVPNVLLTRATGNGVKNGGQAADTFYPANTTVSLSHTLSPAAQVIVQQRSKQSATEMPLLTANNSTVHSSPSRTRAVAIVPPLAQESHLNAAKGASSDTNSQSSKCTTTENSSCNRQTELRKTSNADPINPTQVTSEKSKISDSPAANKSTAPPSDSIGHQDSPQRRLVVEETGSELISNMQVDVPAPLTAPETAEDKTERPNGEEGYVMLSEIETINCVLSSLETITELGNKLMIAEGINPRMLGSEAKIVDLFWNGDADKCKRIMESSWLDKNTTRAQQFCEKYVTEHTVIASKVRKKHVKHLMKHQVLGHNEIYTEPPYKSFWLNLNEQLDDIDKEFGLPWCLRRHACTLESDVQMDEAEILNISEPNDLAKKDSEPEVANLDEQKASCTAGEAPNQKVSPTTTESEDHNDPYKSIEIEVLPLEKAMAIFEQARKGADIQPKIVVDRSAEAEQHEAVSGSMQDNKLDSEPLEMCCFEKLKQIINGSASSECTCQEEGSHNGIVKHTLEETMLDELAKKDVFVLESDVTTSSDNAAKGAASINIPVLSFFDNIDLSKDEEPNDKSDKVISSLPSIMLRGENEDGDPYGVENEISEQTEDLDKAQDEASESGATNQSRAGTETPSDNHVDDEQDLSSFKLALSEDSELSSCESEAQMLGGYGQAQLSSTETTEERSEPGLRISLNLSQVKKWKHRHSLKIVKNQQKDFNLQPEPEDVSKCWTNQADHEPSASHCHTVKLALFGSSQQDESEKYVSQMMRFSPSGDEYMLVEKPPEVVSVLVSPLKRKPSIPIHVDEPPLKLRLQEKWRKSLYQSQVIWRSKLKKQKGPYSSASVMRLKLSKAVGLKQSADPKKRKRRERGKEKSAQKLLSKVIKQRKEKLKRDVATLRKPADQETEEAEGKSYAVRPVQDKNALVFSVLPKTFKFQGGPQESEKPDNLAPSETELVDEKNPDKTVSKEKGSMWNPSYSEKKYCPLQRTTSSLFHEFQKKYAEKTKPE